MMQTSAQLQSNLVDYLALHQAATDSSSADGGPHSHAAASYQTLMALSREMSHIMESMWRTARSSTAYPSPSTPTSTS
jgi:hypothetical protein